MELRAAPRDGRIDCLQETIVVALQVALGTILRFYG